ncbi:leucyl/phenylalanyl-tRNA--protein transferase [Spirochaeta cellobiosiphila]|uniref:leucyl/phenylalanyl-tRNA--protein transferase n=1 Tax=Spirochaeta cellobiosiphila TaxID=504483 RepID=UPI000410FAC5|nr:leucyl/phenylalanyl-tRNA--protein transferase [Spirochaeta cellobiosiphila]
MDLQFPYLSTEEYFQFPHPNTATSEGVVAVGGNLSPGMLLSAYKQGIFPWFSPDEPLLWWSPDPRFVLYPQHLHISKSMKKVLRKGVYDISFDTAFDQVIKNCSNVYRPGQPGTWITDDMESAYNKFHELGYAHSVEAWDDKGNLCGGLYGVSLGRYFFGESMFALAPNASKAAFITLVKTLEQQGLFCIDCQVHTEHLESLGAQHIKRDDFLEELSLNSLGNDFFGTWQGMVKAPI